jgi:hypothetical protein
LSFSRALVRVARLIAGPRLTRVSRIDTQTRVKGLLVIAALATIATTAAPASAALPNQRVDLKVLLLSATGDEPTTNAWEVTLRNEGVPFDEKVASASHTPYTADTFADTMPDGTAHAKYQAVILANGGLLYANDSGQYVSALSDDEWAALRSFEAKFGIRQITAFVYPTPDYGLNYPTTSGDLGGTTASLTATGLQAFPYLQGPVPIDSGAYGYQATPTDSQSFQTLVAGPNQSSLLGIYTRSDGRQEMVSTVDSNAYQVHNQLLRHGMLNWVTRGVYLGYQRNYLELQVDDVFLADERWDTQTNTTPEPSPNPIRMTANDVKRAVNWSQANGLKLDLVFNGSGSVDAIDTNGSDPLTSALLGNKGKFRWINHTYSHTIFDDPDENPTNGLQPADLATIESEIQENIDWAKSVGIPIDKSELVTGGHSGLSLADMPQALADTGVRWIAADASRQPDQYQIGDALTVPRYPTGIYYNVGTKAEQLDEYNYVYLPPSLGGGCVASAVNTCLTTAASWNQYVNNEATIMFRHMLGNDPRPHYMHQSNLAEDGTMYPVVDEVLRRYRAYFNPSIVQLDHSAIGQELARQAQWKQAVDAGQVSGYLLNGAVYVQTTATTQVPFTGTSVGQLYGGQRSGWKTINAGPPVVVNDSDPNNKDRPKISGTLQDGKTLTATSGNWNGTAPFSYAYQWQRCDSAGNNCVNIDGATSSTYTLTPSDIGARLRVVVMASNWISGYSQATSDPTPVAAAAKPVNTASPTVSGTAKRGQTLTAFAGTWGGTQPISYAYQWQRCDASGGGCGNISGARSQTYVLTSSEVGKTIRVVVTATNVAGSTSASSAVTPVVTS